VLDLQVLFSSLEAIVRSEDRIETDSHVPSHDRGDVKSSCEDVDLASTISRSP
jgi:hypothetical protein